ncbi:MAG: RHS repeat-associated protein, partial [Neolewinella sp.]
MKISLQLTLRVLFLTVLGLVLTLKLSAQDEVFVNQLSGQPLKVGATFLVEDDKFSLQDKTLEMAKVSYVENRLTLRLHTEPGDTIAPGVYKVLTEIRYWKKGDEPAKAAANGVLQELAVEVKEGQQGLPETTFLFAGGRKLEIEIKTTSFNDGPLPENAPKMQLVAEVATKRMTCPINLDQTPDHVEVQDLTQYKKEVSVRVIPCAEEYDLEYVFYDRDSKIGQAIASANGTDVLQMESLFQNNATRLTSTATLFRLFDFYRDGYVLARYRGVKYDDNGRRRYTQWSSNDRTLADYASFHGDVSHQENYNWQLTNNFAEEAKQLPAITYFDGTMRGRQNLVLQYGEVNGTPNPASEYAIAQQTIYDGMGRPAVTTLPAPLYPEEIDVAHPLVFTPDALATAAGTQLYGTPQVEEGACKELAPEMGAAAGAGKFYSSSNARPENNAFVPDAESYPFSVSRFTADNTGRIRRQGGVGSTLQAGSEHDTRYYYGKANQWELDRLFGINVGNASHYEKRMVIDPNGQASVSYVDAKGRTIATALAGERPDQLDPITSYLAASKMQPIQVSILNNIREEDAVMATYSILVDTEQEYDLCYALGKAEFATGCCLPDQDNPNSAEGEEDMAEKSRNKTFAPTSTCPSCTYDLVITLTGDCDFQPVEFIRSGITNLGDLLNCQGAASAELQDLLLPVGEYHLSKKLTVNDAAIDAAMEDYLNNAECIQTEQQFIEAFLADVDISGCAPCDCPTTPFPGGGTGIGKRGEDDRCEEYCATVSPCEVQYRLMAGDLVPGGQYARFDVVSGTEYNASDPLSIFNPDNPALIGTPLAGQPYYQQITYGTAMVNINGLPLNPEQLTVKQFVENFSDDWIPFLIDYHPEKCLLDECITSTDSVVVAAEYSSNGWDVRMREARTYAQAAAQPFFSDQNDFDSYATLRSMVDLDPYFILNPEQKSEFNWVILSDEAADNDTRNDILHIMQTSMEGLFGDANGNWSFDAAPTYQKDIAWLTLRELYLGKKALFLEEKLIDHCLLPQNDHPLHGDNWACLLQAVCENFACDPLEATCADVEFYGEYNARIPLFTRTTVFASNDADIDASWDPNSSNPTGDVQEQQDALADQQLAACNVACTSYRDQWRQELELCGRILPSDTVRILNEFELICAEGCTEGKPFGSSYITDDPAFNNKKPSFIAVLNAYLQPAASTEECSTCNSYLFNFPPPSDMDLYTTTMVVGADELAIWLVTNADFLTDRMNYFAKFCYCSKGDYSSCGPEYMADFNNLPIEVARNAWDVISAFVTNDTIPTGNVDFIVPAEFNPGGNYCVTRGFLDTLVSNEMPEDCGRDDSNGLLGITAQFINARLGWTRDSSDYQFILDGYATDATACMICAEPMPESFDPPSPSCEEQLYAAATDQALVAYERYQEFESASFRDRYVEKCLDGADERLEMAYRPLEHHYTLYYYDQSGNLTMTVPPEGVKPISGTEMPDAIAEYREAITESQPPPAADYPTLLPKHVMLTDYAYNNFNEVSVSDNPDKAPAETWYDPLGRVALSQDGRQKDESIAQNGNWYSYTLYDPLGRTKEVGEFNVWNFAPSVVVDIAEAGGIEFFTVGAQKKFVTKTYYTNSPLDIPALEQNDLTLRNRVAAVTFANTGSNTASEYDFASHYSYDIAGNVEEMVQEFRELEDVGHQYKKIAYDYDLISGNVHAVFYQRGFEDQFTYRYEYDKTNRLVNVLTSEFETEHSNSTLWKRDAAYTYFDYGPLKRTVLGQDRLQGMDYAYTIQGWIKGVNGGWGSRRNFWRAQSDMGADGLNVSWDYGALDPVAYRDLYRYENQYFNNDYRPIGFSETAGNPFYTANNGIDQLFNGNIASHQTLTAEDSYAVGFLKAKYDQLHRITSGQYRALHQENQNSTSPSSNFTRALPIYNYDGNGNMVKLDRYYTRRFRNRTFNGANELAYVYEPGTNRLNGVNPTAAGDVNYRPFEFIEGPQSYVYDGAGNLVTQTDERPSRSPLVANLRWTPYGKVSSVNTTTSTIDDEERTVTYGYGPDQNRWVKANDRNFGRSGFLRDSEYQVRDAQGNTLATYYRGTSNSGSLSTPFTWRQQYLYGSSRLGQVGMDRELANIECYGCDDGSTPSPSFGTRLYELSNHLGNVTTVFSENIETREETDGNLSLVYHTPELVSFTDYLPFGLELNRTLTDAGSENYRYGFNGKEKDNDGEWGSLTHYDYGFRIYNPGIAKFLSVDPLAPDYPWYTPYQFAGNMPVAFIDLDGLEPARPESHWNPSWTSKDKYKHGKMLLVDDNYIWISSNNLGENVYKYYNQGWFDFSPMEERNLANDVTLFSTYTVGGVLGSTIAIPLLEAIGATYIVNNFVWEAGESFIFKQNL